MEWKSAEKKEGDLLKIPKRWLRIHYYEALNILFRFENSLRVFVYAVLKNEFRDKWQECTVTLPNSAAQPIRAIAARRIGQAETFGYLGFDIRAPLMHLTSGELIELLTSDAYWPKFKRYFRGDKGIIKNKLQEIGSIRNSLAHFRPIKADDIELVKQNSRHTLVGVEECLKCLFTQSLRVPTNTSDEWYTAISTLGTANISITPYFSSDESWINVSLIFDSPVLHTVKYSDSYYEHTLLKLKPANFLIRHDSLKKHVTYVSERRRPISMAPDNTIRVIKEVNFVFRRDVLTEAYAEIAEGFVAALGEVKQECELLQQDSLARGHLVECANGESYSIEREDKVTWHHEYDALLQFYATQHPDEYWGQHLYGPDVVAGRARYPWMPEDISGREGVLDL